MVRTVCCTCALHPKPHSVESKSLLSHKFELSRVQREQEEREREREAALQDLSILVTAVTLADNGTDEISPTPNALSINDVMRSVQDMATESHSTTTSLSGTSHAGSSTPFSVAPSPPISSYPTSSVPLSTETSTTSHSRPSASGGSSWHSYAPPPPSSSPPSSSPSPSSSSSSAPTPSSKESSVLSGPSHLLSPPDTAVAQNPEQYRLPGVQGGHYARKLKMLDEVEIAAQDVMNRLFQEDKDANNLRKLLSDSSGKVAEFAQLVKNTSASQSSQVAARGKDIMLYLKGIENRITLLGASLPPHQEDFPKPIDTDYAFSNPTAKLDTIAQIAILLGVVCNTLFGLAQDPCTFILETVHILLRLAMSTATPSATALNGNQTHIIGQVPMNVQSALKKLNVDSVTTVHAVCPSCDYVVSPTLGAADVVPRYPEICPNQIIGKTGRAACSTPLLEVRDGHRRPIRPYLTASIVDHLARELTNPEVESFMDEACGRAMECQNSSPNDIRDPFEAEFLRTFKGPNGIKPFVDREGSEAKVAYLMHTDSFNPHGNKSGGNHNSVTMITLANLALPDSIRNQPEHLLLCAIIPGPKEPELANISYFLRPIIDELAIGWNPGYHFSRTALHPNGRDIYMALIISSNDLPAARKISGSPGVTAHRFCTVCSQEGYDAFYDTHLDQWSGKNISMLRRKAEEWRDAQTSSEQDLIFEEYGVRWSELWRLPYWDPTRMLIVDPMHTLLEGLVHYHCRRVLNFDEKIAALKQVVPAYDHDWKQYITTEVPPEYQLRNIQTELPQVTAIQKLLTTPLAGEGAVTLEELEEKLQNKNLSPLRYMCWALHTDFQVPVIDKMTLRTRLVPARTKRHFAMLLTRWRATKPCNAPNALTRVSSTETLAYIQHVIQHTSTPSFITSVPKRYGEHSAGTVKAHEWFTLSTIFLPIALITLWGDDGHTPNESRYMKILDHTMALFQAVVIQARYSTNASSSRQYQMLLKRWVDDLYILHPHTAEHQRRAIVHGAFHIGDFLLLFGPVMSWWTFPFERLVGRLQRLSSNHAVGGPLESTLLQAFLRGCNLRRWLGRPGCPPVIRQIRILLDKAFTSISAFSTPEDHASIKKNGDHAHYHIGKRNFSIANSHLGNSIVLYYSSDSLTDFNAGSIQKIQTFDGDTVFHIQPLAPLPDGLRDPFTRYPYLHAKTFSSRICTKLLDVVPVRNVIGHAAKYDFSLDRCVVVNLCRE